jgi:hypothetical protein
MAPLLPVPGAILQVMDVIEIQSVREDAEL